MSVKDSLAKFLDSLPEDRLRQLLDFAEFLSFQQERDAWQRFGQAKLALAYGTNEPEYTRADLKAEVKA